MNEGGLTTDPLFIGATRPPMKLGITFNAWLFNFIVTVNAVSVTSNVLLFAIWLPMHGVCYAACKHDPRFFDLAILWLRTRGPGWLGNLRYYKANAYSPLAIDMPDINGKRRGR